MTDAPQDWPPGAREAVAHAMRQSLYPGRILGKWDDQQRALWGTQADAALAALAPYLAAALAEARKAGLREGMEKAAGIVDQISVAIIDGRPAPNSMPRCVVTSGDIAAAIRALAEKEPPHDPR
jgi:hypothetical protein